MVFKMVIERNYLKTGVLSSIIGKGKCRYSILIHHYQFTVRHNAQPNRRSSKIVVDIERSTFPQLIDRTLQVKLPFPSAGT